MLQFLYIHSAYLIESHWLGELSIMVQDKKYWNLISYKKKHLWAKSNVLARGAAAILASLLKSSHAVCLKPVNGNISSLVQLGHHSSLDTLSWSSPLVFHFLRSVLLVRLLETREKQPYTNTPQRDSTLFIDVYMQYNMYVCMYSSKLLGSDSKTETQTSTITYMSSLHLTLEQSWLSCTCLFCVLIY